MRLRSLSVLISALLAVTSLSAQTFRGAISGTVEDPSGAVLADAKVTSTHIATGVARSALTSASGDFSFPDLPVGAYLILASKTGFSEQKSQTEVAVSRVSSIAFKLTLASQSSSVQVEAAVESVETSSTTLTGVVGTKTVSDLPMNGRDFRQIHRPEHRRRSDCQPA